MHAWYSIDTKDVLTTMRDTVPILFFVKSPLHEPVKSRIAASLGRDRTEKIYRACVEDMLDAIDASGHPCISVFHPAEAAGHLARWLGPHRRYQPQTGADLGERMAHAFSRAFASGSEGAILIGSDIPDLSAGILESAAQALDDADTVIGPAADGGYYLIGFRRGSFRSGLFRNIPWSTPRVLAATRERLHSANLTVRELRQFRDVDTIEDLLDLARRNAGSTGSCRRTLALLADPAFTARIPEEDHAPL